MIVVSDGSVDGTAERVLESELPNVRVLYYDRNLGKGYAVKTGAREARGRWVSYVDADLDLDPASLPVYMATAERERLDFAIGSKRHPDSNVIYPRSRVVASWLYQQFVRVFFRLDVRDTQVGIKVFRREVAKEVMPLLLVKRYAFDVELLAVSRAFGYGRVKEMPISLDYRFTGSGVRSMAVVHALLRHPRGVLPPAASRLLSATAGVCAISPGRRERLHGLSSRRSTRCRQTSQAGRGRGADTEILAFIEPGAHPSANWLSSTLPFFAAPRSLRSSRLSSRRLGGNTGSAPPPPSPSPDSGAVRSTSGSSPGASGSLLTSRHARFSSGETVSRARPGDAPRADRVRARRRRRANAVPARCLRDDPACAALSQSRRIGVTVSRGIGVRSRGISVRVSTMATLALLPGPRSGGC